VGLVALVAVKPAELDYVLRGDLNLMPSARNVHGLVKIFWKLLKFRLFKWEKMEKRLFGICMESGSQALAQTAHTGCGTSILGGTKT